MNVAYIRRNDTADEIKQVTSLREYKIDKFYQEVISQDVHNHREREKMIESVNAGDKVYVSSFSCISDNPGDLLNVIKQLEEKQVRFVSKKEALDTLTEKGRIMVSTIAFICDLEKAGELSDDIQEPDLGTLRELAIDKKYPVFQETFWGEKNILV